MGNPSHIHYRRLPGKGLRREGPVAITRTYCTLWLANDHILNIDNHVFSEDYKRFYFRDIQAIIIQKTRRGMVWNIILAILAGLFLLITTRFKGIEAMLPWLIVAGTFGLALLVNWLRGPTCKCYIITPVHKEMLPSLDRVKKAEKVLRILRRSIQKAQEDLHVEGTEPDVSATSTQI